MSQRSIEPVGPQMRAGLAVDELAGDANLAAGLADAAFEDVAHTQFMPDLLDVNGAALIGKRAVPGDHKKRFEARERGDDVLDHAVGEVFLIGIAAHVGERQHRDGGLVGKCEQHFCGGMRGGSLCRSRWC
jgi:hypothetical protein